MADDDIRLLRIYADGKLLAEAPLIIYDQEETWKVFLSTFALMSKEIVSELFESFRIACNDELKAALGKDSGIKVNIQTRPAQTLYVPSQNGQGLPPLPGGF